MPETIKVCCLSDLHGHLPDLSGLDFDLLVLAGDYCPMSRVPDQMFWLRDAFGPWLARLAGRAPIVGVAGNHDFIFEKRPDLVPRLPWTYLQDSGAEVFGLRIYGSPWQPRFFDWAYNLDEPELAAKWAAIPDATDILVLHGPPSGIGDRAAPRHGDRRIGSPSLRARIEAIRPTLVVCGHNHAGYGIHHPDRGGPVVVNAAMMDDDYRPVNPPIVVEIPGRSTAAV